MTMIDDPEAIWDPIVDYVKGILEGINLTFQSDLKLINSCFAAPSQIYEAWVKFAEFMKNMKEFKFDEFISHLWKAIEATIGNAIPCVFLGMMADKFIELIIDPTFERLKYSLMKTIVMNCQVLFNALLKMFFEPLKGNWFTAGEYAGQFWYIILVH